MILLLLLLPLPVFGLATSAGSPGTDARPALIVPSSAELLGRSEPTAGALAGTGYTKFLGW